MGEINTKLKIDGERQYNAALTSSYGKIKEINSALKAETSALGTNASAQAKAQAKANALKAKIAQQERVVKTLKSAVQQATSQFGANSDAAVKWRTKLNNAEAALNTMRNQLDNLGDGLERSADQMGESAQKTANFAEGLKGLSGIASSVSSSVSGVFNTMYNNVSAIADNIKQLIDTVFAYVGNYGHIADAYGGSQVDIQKTIYGLEAAGMGSGDLTKMLAKWQAAMQGNGKLYRQFIGMYKDDPTMSIDGTEDVYTQFMKAMAIMERAQRQGVDLTKYTNGIFGAGDAGGANVERWLNKWGVYSSAIEDMESSGGFLDETQLSNLNGTLDKMNTLLAAWNELKINVGASLVTMLGLDTMSEDAKKTIEDVIKLLTALGKGDDAAAAEALKDFEIDITVLATDITDAITKLNEFTSSLGETLEGSDNSILSLLGHVLTTLSTCIDGIMTFIEQNPELAQTLADFFVGNKLIELLTGKSGTEWLTDIAKALLTIKATTVLLYGDIVNKGANAAANAATSTAVAVPWYKKAWDTVKNGATSVGGWLAGTALPFTTGALGGLAAFLGIGAGVKQAGDVINAVSDAYEENVKIAQEGYGYGEAGNQITWDANGRPIINGKTLSDEEILAMNAIVADRNAAWRGDKGAGFVLGDFWENANIDDATSTDRWMYNYLNEANVNDELNNPFAEAAANIVETTVEAAEEIIPDVVEEVIPEAVQEAVESPESGFSFNGMPISESDMMIMWAAIRAFNNLNAAGVTGLPDDPNLYDDFDVMQEFYSALANAEPGSAMMELYNRFTNGEGGTVDNPFDSETIGTIIGNKAAGALNGASVTIDGSVLIGYIQTELGGGLE